MKLELILIVTAISLSSGHTCIGRGRYGDEIIYDRSAQVKNTFKRIKSTLIFIKFIFPLTVTNVSIFWNERSNIMEWAKF